MHFQTFAPPDLLKPYVKYFYVATAPAMAASSTHSALRVIADGCPGILLQATPGGRFFQQEQALPSAFLFGQSTRYNDLQLEGSFNAIGAYLQPNALHALFGLPAASLTDGCTDLSALEQARSFQLMDRLEEATSAERRVQLLAGYLAEEWKHNAGNEHAAMQYALDKMIATHGRLSMPALQQELQITARTFERRFKQYVGISPKLFARICNFQASLKQLHRQQFSKLSDLAYEHDYADQSHFIRAFREFAGLTPNQYQKQSSEVVENLSLLR